ncbi:MAG: CDP-diacylglycerol O-phosphatidyltransferase [Acidobacteria bacterium]|nr:MAG: CDP-diacylglycerol O-phosphatidyltransferase [Acidobacteriota bacterium]
MQFKTRPTGARSSLTQYNPSISGSLNHSSATPWLAHAYTALGAVLALLATLEVIAGDYRRAFIWLTVQVLVDATDGLLARRLRVKERLPQFDGARLDDIVDYLCYVFVPVLLLLRANLLPAAWGVAIASAVLLSSAYGFSQTAAKRLTTDHFFTGFPSYWNVVAFYLYLLEWPPAANAAVLLVLALLVFVPLRYIYPSRTRTFATLTTVLGGAWALLMLWMLWRLPAKDSHWIAVSLVFPAYYMAASIRLDRRTRAVDHSITRSVDQ